MGNAGRGQEKPYNIHQRVAQAFAQLCYHRILPDPDNGNSCLEL